MVILAFAATIAFYQRDAANARLAQETRLIGSNFAATLQAHLNARFKAGEILGQRFVDTENVDMRTFREEATLTHELYDDFQALSWVDAAGVIRIVTPEKGNAAALGLDLHTLPIPSRTLARAEATGRLQVTPPIELAQGGRGFAAYIPVSGEAGRKGFVNVVFRSGPLFNSVLLDVTARPYAVRVADGDDVIFETSKEASDPDFVQVSNIAVANRQWTVAIAPAPDLADRASAWLDETIVIFGLLGAAFAAYTTRLVFVRQAAVRESDARLRVIATNINDAVWVVTSDFKEIRYCNPAFERIFGLPWESLESPSERRPENLGSEEWDKLKRASGEDSPIDRFDCPIFKVVGSDGISRDVYARFAAMRDGNDRIDRFVGVATDVSELMKAQEHLRRSNERLFQSQKMEAIGQLTGGVAHDFNNLLFVILANAEFVRDRMADPQIVEALDEIVRTSERGSDLTKNMLAFAGKSRLVPRAWDLNTVIRQAQSWMTRALPESISVEVSLLAGLWPVLIDRTALESALLNLLLNAKDAMNGKGKLTIETANVRIDDAYNEERGEGLVSGRHVMLAVSDNGAGIASEDISRIFEPFFTTKQADGGTGLGLSMVQGFIKQSGGTVRVYSEIGEGTTFKIYIPASCEHPVPEHREKELSDKAQESARILVVEDQGEIRKLLARQLRGAGYAVVEARDGDEGLELYGDGGGFDLVITDIVMPGTLQGPALAKQIRSRKSDERFVFMSGYATEAQVHGNGLRPQDIRLTKPVRRAEFLASVRQALQRTD
ncbi:ATP-binding protein [Novosphingobium sp. JCM 18896]|nr:ATP-binding protein [Novosphingobium sp. JCM 18896]